ncbi:hypothetical protein CCP3SC1AL1_770007 [Gammaproteobacteria bacterium]
MVGGQPGSDLRQFSRCDPDGTGGGVRQRCLCGLGFQPGGGIPGGEQREVAAGDGCAAERGDHGEPVPGGGGSAGPWNCRRGVFEAAERGGGSGEGNGGEIRFGPTFQGGRR